MPRDFAKTSSAFPISSCKGENSSSDQRQEDWNIDVSKLVLSYDRTKAFVHVKKECRWHMGRSEKQKDFFNTRYASTRCDA